MRAILTFILIVFGAAVAAQEDVAWNVIGDDVFIAGYSINHFGEGADDVFMAGNSVSVSASSAGDAALAGQNINVDGNVGGDLYAAGQTIDVSGTVGGDVTVMGQDIRLGAVDGDLRAGGASISVEGPVAGYAIVGGARVEIGGPIGGDLHLAADRVEFAKGATVGGTIYLYEEKGEALDLPDFVLNSAEIERLAIEEFPDEGRSFILKSFLGGVITVAIIAALLAAVAPERLAGMRRSLLDRPFRALWVGFLGLSVLTGAGFITALTLVGLILTPAFLLVAGLAAFAGYIVGAYSLGVGLLLAIGMEEPDTLLVRAGAALLGALSAAIIALAPFLGWLFVVVLILAGVGVLIQAIFRPRFFAEEA